MVCQMVYFYHGCHSWLSTLKLKILEKYVYKNSAIFATMLLAVNCRWRAVAESCSWCAAVGVLLLVRCICCAAAGVLKLVRCSWYVADKLMLVPCSWCAAAGALQLNRSISIVIDK